MKINQAFHQLHRNDISVEVHARSGADFDRIPFPTNIEKFGPEANIFIFPFGNDIFQKNSHQISHLNGKKILHLAKFSPNSEKHLIDRCKKLEQKLKDCAAKIFIVTSFYRHLYCCESHRYPGLLKHQNRQNKIITQYFKNKYTVLDHQTLVQDKKIKRPTAFVLT